MYQDGSYCSTWKFVFRYIASLITDNMIHLLIFIVLTFILILRPVISKSENKISSILTNRQSLKKASFLKPYNLLPNLILLMDLFEYLFQNTFGVHFLWTSGFVSWILGCCFWLLQTEFVSLLFISASTIFCLLAIYDISDLKLCEISALRKRKFSVTPYILIISISVLTMVAFNSLAIGLTMNTLLLLSLYDWKVIKKPKQKQDAISRG